MRDAFERRYRARELVISRGGLGPTEDDLTREAVAELLGRKLHTQRRHLRGIQERFRRLGAPMPEVNARQAMVPEGADSARKFARHRARTVA